MPNDRSDDSDDSRQAPTGALNADRRNPDGKDPDSAGSDSEDTESRTTGSQAVDDPDLHPPGDASTREPSPATGAAPALTFSRLQVRRLYGLDHDLSVDELSEDVNIIYGSNASGKTTLARALRLLLWPDSSEDERPIASGRFSLGGDHWSVDLEGSACRYQRNRQVASRPTLPPNPHRRRYHLYLPDLLTATDGDGEFARQILQEAQGGVDIAAAADGLGWEIPNRRRGKTARRVEEQREAVREAEAAQRDLREKEASLDALREELEGAREARARVDALQQAIDLAHARRQHTEARARLDAFPDEMDAVRGDEAETLDRLQERLREAEQEIEDQTAALRDAKQRMADSMLPADGLPDGRLQTIRRLAESIREQERTIRETRDARAGAETEEETAWERLGAGVDRDVAATIDLPTIGRVEDHVRNVEDLRGKQSAHQEMKRLLQVDDEPNREVLERGLRALQRWLQVPEKDATARPASVGTILLGIAVSGVGGGLWAVGASVPTGVAPVLLVLGACIVAIEVWRRSTRTSMASSRAAHEDAYRRTGLDPVDWSREAVEQKADRLLERVQAARLQEEKQSEWQRLRPLREEVEKTARSLAEERARIAEEVGLDPDVSSRSLAYLVDRLSQWQSSYDEAERLRAKLEEAENTAAAQRAQLQSHVDPYGIPEIESAADAAGVVERLETAHESFREAERDRDQAKAARTRARRARERIESEIEDLYDRLGLSGEEEDILRKRAAQHAEYKEAEAAEQEARIARTQKRKQLRDRTGYEAAMEEADPEALRSALREAEEQASKEEEVARTIHDIERDIEEARNGGTLEERRAAYREARHALARERDDDYGRAAGAALADYLRTKTRNQGMPPVFERARELFAEITQNRYELDLDPQTVSFRAIDRVEDRGFALDALSSGTKVQLLLAVRVAFVESQEQGCRVPLVLDETLANSDEEKATAMIRALRTISASGRQIFYLTAQQDEVQKWQAALDGEQVSCRVVALSELDGGDPAARSEQTEVPAAHPVPDLPDPETTSHEEMGRALGVPRWSPCDPLGKLPLWYLIEDAGRLAALVEAGVRTWGQLEFQYRRAGLAATGLDERVFRRVQARAEAVSSWKEAWHVGRGKPVDRLVLERSGAVSEKFIDGVSEIADELDGDAEALLQELRERTDERTKGFYSSKAEELEAYLREHDHLDARKTKSPDEMWQYVQADLAEERRRGLVDAQDLNRLFTRLRNDPLAPPED